MMYMDGNNGQAQALGQGMEKIEQGSGIQTRGIGQHQCGAIYVHTKCGAAKTRNAQAAPGPHPGHVMQAHGQIR